MVATRLPLESRGTLGIGRGRSAGGGRRRIGALGASDSIPGTARADFGAVP